MHYAGKKEFYLHLGGGNFVFSHFPVIFFFLQNIDSHLKKKKRTATLFLSEVFIYGSCTLQSSSMD